MNDVEIRMECVRLATSLCVAGHLDLDQAMEAAERFYRFIKGEITLAAA
jgi:hypothetical protein